MMVVISNPKCVCMLRENAATNTEMVERALCKALGIKPRHYRAKAQGRPKETEKQTRVPVKINDARIVDYILERKRETGAPYRHTAEKAMLAMPKRRKAVAQ